jgi:uracil-DNA glycosylase
MNLEINSCIGLTEKLKEEAKKGYFIEITNFLNKEFDKQKIIYPPTNKVFSAFNFVKFEEIKVVILGQDPYHGPKEANGLAFSVDTGIKIPPSLRNIYNELSNDLHLGIPKHGDLRSWAEQGVLLLNSVLTVEENQPGSHATIGWQNFTDRVIQALDEELEQLVFILWGNYAKSKLNLINAQKHMVISSPHPSPFSANRGFIGSKPFSKANDYLRKNNKPVIRWEII